MNANAKEKKIPKEVRRNMERQKGLQGIVESVTRCIRRSVEISTTRKSGIVDNICDTIDDISENIIGLVRAESDYMVYDEIKRDKKFKKQQKRERIGKEIVKKD